MNNSKILVKLPIL